MVSSVVQAMELGAQRARQREEDAYQKARRPIENAFSDQLSQARIDATKQGIDISGAAEKRAQTTFDREEQAASDKDLYAAGALFNEAIARQIDANPGAKPSDIIKNAPPEVLKRVKLDTPEAQAHFAQIYDADPSQLRAHAQMYGGSGRKVKSSIAVIADDGTEGFLQTFEDGQTHFVPGYAAKPTGAAGAFTLGDTRYDASGNPIVVDTGAVQRAAQVKAEGTTVGKAEGANKAEDLPWSQSDFNKASDVIANKAARFQNLSDAIDRAVKKVGPASAGLGANTKDIAGTPAAGLKAELNTIGSIIGLDELQRLRDASKTGGALGSVTEKEHAYLQSVIAGIDQGMEEKDLIRALNEVKQKAKESWARVQAAYERDVRQFGNDAVEAPTPKGGKKLKYNPATGELE